MPLTDTVSDFELITLLILLFVFIFMLFTTSLISGDHLYYCFVMNITWDWRPKQLERKAIGCILMACSVVLFFFSDNPSTLDVIVVILISVAIVLILAACQKSVVVPRPASPRRDQSTQLNEEDLQQPAVQKADKSLQVCVTATTTPVHSNKSVGGRPLPGKWKLTQLNQGELDDAFMGRFENMDAVQQETDHTLDAADFIEQRTLTTCSRDELSLSIDMGENSAKSPKLPISTNLNLLTPEGNANSSRALELAILLQSQCIQAAKFSNELCAKWIQQQEQNNQNLSRLGYSAQDGHEWEMLGHP